VQIWNPATHQLGQVEGIKNKKKGKIALVFSKRINNRFDSFKNILD
jgi:hypothetical protein